MTYLDTSVLFSLHYRDANSQLAVPLVKRAAAPLLISSLVEVEVVNAFNLRVFRQEMTLANMQTAVRDLESDLRAGIVIVKPVPDAAYARAKSLAQALTPSIGLRAADVLHVAAAIELGAGALFTFDQRQHKAATAAGLAVNPLSWPH